MHLAIFSCAHFCRTQCPKFRVHPAPYAHISMAGCTIFGGVHPEYARFLSHLVLLCIGRVHGTISGCTVLREVHPASAQTKSLISDTVTILKIFIKHAPARCTGPKMCAPGHQNVHTGCRVHP